MVCLSLARRTKILLKRLNWTEQFVESAQGCFFRDQLRIARAAALADAEGFQAVLYALELMGQQLVGKVAGLSDYRPTLLNLAADSPLANDLPSQWPGFHTDFRALYEELQQARNDAMHQGAYARTLTHHAIEMTLILEDALMSNASMVSQFMVRTVIEAKPWHPVSYIRQQMLTQAFSYLPIRHLDAWKFIPEYSIARYLRNVSQTLRKRRLATTVSDAVAKAELELLDASIVPPDAQITEALPLIAERPLLVVESKHEEVLVGLLTASDVL